MTPTPRKLAEDPRIQAKELFEILVREHEGRLRAFLQALVRDPVATEDLVQESFLVAWKNLDRYDREQPFGPWVRGIGRRLSMAHFRKSGRDKHEFVDEQTVDALSQLHDEFDLHPGDTLDEKLSSLRACLERLPEHQARVLTLHYNEDLDCQAIAETVGRSREAVKKLLQRARAWLGSCIEQRLAAVGDPS
jgi:RNA polymerase sigma-70 factor